MPSLQARNRAANVGTFATADSLPEPPTLDVGLLKWSKPTRIPTFEEMKAQFEKSRRFLAQEQQEFAVKYGQ